MRSMVEKILRGYGREVTLCHNGEKRSARVFLQLSARNAQQHASFHPGIAGMEEVKYYTYIGPVWPEAVAGDEIIAGEKHYILRSAETIYGAGKGIYIWGICVEKGADVIGA